MREVDFNEALEVLGRGDVLIYPTETCYGMGVDIRNEAAIQKVFALKGREEVKAVSVLVPDQTLIQSLVQELSSKELKLIQKFLPGPVTLILQASSTVPLSLRGGGRGIGIRISSHPLAQHLVRSFGRPITTTSANPSGRENGRSLSQLWDYFGKEEVFLLSGGDLPPSRGSTVVQVVDDALKLLREGEIKFTEIQQL